LTIVGTVFKVFYCGRWEIISTAIYLLMGWSMLAGGNSFFERMPHAVLQMVIAGGIIYSLGVIFYLWDKIFLQSCAMASLRIGRSYLSLCSHTAVGIISQTNLAAILALSYELC
jgi:predicted membrane channel-forming protein YqfA (hemolysin III family)